MSLPLMLLALAAPACDIVPTAHGRASVPVARHAEDSLARAYRSGQTWAAYYATVDARRETWERNWTRGRVPEDLVARARAASAGLRLLVITEPRCSDSANSIPYVARLAEAIPSLGLRLIDSNAGRRWMEAHRTPDGRAATPTVLVLDERYEIVGCWVEQPKKLQEWWLPVVASRAQGSNIARKMSWYTADAGRETLREIAEILEGAQAGRRICPGLP